MSTANRIHDIVYNHPTGDVEGYFKYMDEMISVNSGNHDYRILSHDSYSISVPVPENQATKFLITDPSMDIVDMSQSYINLKCQIDLNMVRKANSCSQLEKDKVVNCATYGMNACYFFVGFKSGAHIIDQYNVFSNGRLTSCKQTKSKFEQTIVYNCKAKEQKKARPGMYSAHKDVLKMRDCVCGRYIKVLADTNQSQSYPQIDFDIVIQIDDLLPFSAMTYYPRYAVKDLELEIICNLQKNMVFCQVPVEEVLLNHYACEEEGQYTTLFDEFKKNADNNPFWDNDSENFQFYKESNVPVQNSLSNGI